ncbi:hypothetical protein BDK51DRAFT_29865, partial [Blyttiomyces helicus]
SAVAEEGAGAAEGVGEGVQRADGVRREIVLGAERVVAVCGQESVRRGRASLQVDTASEVLVEVVNEDDGAGTRREELERFSQEKDVIVGFRIGINLVNSTHLVWGTTKVIWAAHSEFPTVRKPVAETPGRSERMRGRTIGASMEEMGDILPFNLRSLPKESQLVDGGYWSGSGLEDAEMERLEGEADAGALGILGCIPGSRVGGVFDRRRTWTKRGKNGSMKSPPEKNSAGAGVLKEKCDAQFPGLEEKGADETDEENSPQTPPSTQR